MALPPVEMLPLLAAGVPGLAEAYNRGLQCATAVAAAATATATQAAIATKENCAVYYDFSIYDANIGVDGYAKVEIIRDNAAAGGGKTVLYTRYFDWDFSVDIVVISESVWLPAPIRSGTVGETLDCTVTTALAADAVTVNILSIPV